jgi:hypothetical protein
MKSNNQNFNAVVEKRQRFPQVSDGRRRLCLTANDSSIEILL